MARLYDKMTLLQQVVALLVGIQKKAWEVVKLLKVANKVVDHLQEWVSKYPDAIQHVENKYRIVVEIDRVHMRLHHENYMCLREWSIGTVATYNRLHNFFESLTQKHGMPAIGTLEGLYVPPPRLAYLELVDLGVNWSLLLDVSL